MGPLLVHLAHDVEEERVHVVISAARIMECSSMQRARANSQSLVIEKQLGEVAKVLAVYLLLGAVDLEHGHGSVAVDLVAGRVLQQELLI